MNCRRARNLLFDFFDGSSNESLRAEVERHLGECAECERFAAEMTRSLSLLKRVPQEPLDENFNWKVKLAIHRERNAALTRARSASAWVRMWNVRYAISSGLGFSAALVAGLIVIRSGMIALPGGSGAGSDAARDVTVASAPAQTEDTFTGPRMPPHSTTNLRPSGDASHLVSAGSASPGQQSGPVAGAIDKTEAEARIDSLINSEMMKMPAAERELYLQRHIERLLKQLQSQQSAPAQP